MQVFWIKDPLTILDPVKWIGYFYRYTESVTQETIQPFDARTSTTHHNLIDSKLAGFEV